VWRWLVLLAGCGRIGFASVTDAGSGLPTDASLQTYRAAVVADHPVAYWRLDDSDTTAGDVMGSFPGAYTGTCTHGVSGALADDPDTATYFNGCTMSATNAPSFTGSAAFTIEVWFQPDVLAATLVMKETRTTTTDVPIDGYALVTDATRGGWVERVVGQSIDAVAATPLPSQAFHYLVGTYDGAVLAFYLDGAVTQMTGDNRALNTTAAPLQVGGWGAPPAGMSQGRLDEVAVYDHALAASRIALHYDLAINGPQP
jgi:hypothetical protein